MRALNVWEQECACACACARACACACACACAWCLVPAWAVRLEARGLESGSCRGLSGLEVSRLPDMVLAGSVLAFRWFQLVRAKIPPSIPATCGVFTWRHGAAD